MKPMNFALLAAAIVFASLNVMRAQTVRITLLATDQLSPTDSVVLGFDPAATNNIDSALGEHVFTVVTCPECPIPQDIRSVSIASGVGQDTCLTGIKVNLHRGVRINQSDRWRIQFSSSENGGAMKFSWPGNLASTGPGGWLLQDGSGLNAFPDVDMTAETTFTYPMVSVDPQFIYISTFDGLKFRTFRQEEIAFSDSKGKAIKRQPVRVDFALKVYADSDNVDGLHMEFTHAIDTTFPFTTLPPSVITRRETKGHKWDFQFPFPLNTGDSVQVYGYGSRGKPQKIPKYSWMRSGVTVGKNRKSVSFLWNDPKLPLPNINNVGEELYAQGAFPPDSGLIIGLKTTKKLVIHKKWKDVLKTLVKKDIIHNLDPRCLDIIDNTGRPIVTVQKSLPPTKHNNVLLAEAIAFKLSLVSSSPLYAKTPVGLADLLFQSANPRYQRYNGMALGAFPPVLDSALSCVPSSIVGSDPDSVRILYEVIRAIDSAFSGSLDTASFGLPQDGKPSGGTILTGVRAVGLVDFLVHTPGLGVPQVPPMAFRASALAPAGFALSQNYPNPFNPTTTIEFTLAAPARVTLKVYDALGREVATLVDNERMEDGDEEVEFDGGRLSSGVYFYRLTAEVDANPEEGLASSRFSTVKKMILLK